MELQQCFLGYVNRLEKEIRNLYKEINLKESKTIKIDINIIDSPRRKFSVFIGARVLTETYNGGGKSDEYWISKNEWSEIGPDIIFKKCQNILL